MDKDCLLILICFFNLTKVLIKALRHHYGFPSATPAPWQSKVELLPDGLVRLDGWIKLKLDDRVAALVSAMRPAISQLVKRCAGDPESLGEPGQREEQVVQVVRQLAKVNAGGWRKGSKHGQSDLILEGTEVDLAGQARVHLPVWRQREGRGRGWIQRGRGWGLWWRKGRLQMVANHPPHPASPPPSPRFSRT